MDFILSRSSRRRAAKPTVLVVDDNDAHCYVLARVASAANFNTHEVCCGKAAIDAAREMRPDIILLDVFLPDIDGYEVCRTLKRDPATSGIPILFISSKYHEDDVDEGRQLARAAGGEDLITRANAVENLGHRLHELLRRKMAS